MIFEGFLQCSPPSTPLPANYYILVDVDYNNSVAESDETNNAISTSSAFNVDLLATRSDAYWDSQTGLYYLDFWYY